MEMDVAGRASKVGGDGVIRGSVWETRMRMDQVKGGIKVFGVLDQEDEGDRGGAIRIEHEKRDGEEEEMGVMADKNTIPLRRIGVRGGKRRTWKPQPETFEGPIRVIGEKPDRTDGSPIELPKSRSESTGGPQEKDSAETRKGKLESLQKTGEKINNGIVSGESAEVSENGAWKQSSGSPEKVIVMNSRKKMTAKTKKPPTHHVGQFKIGPQELGRNDGGNDEEEEEDEFFDIKEISVAEQKPKTPVLEENKVRVSLFREKPTKPISAPVIKQQPCPSPVSKRPTVQPSFAKDSSHECKNDSKRQNRVHNLSDMVMWRDAPKSAVVLGLGTLFIISSSYMNDPNMCSVSAVSYLGLACLSAVFLYRSIIWSGDVDVDNISFHELGEEEVLCLTKTLLPYLNGLLRKLRALLSGDPANTMKLAVLLFVLARCGSFVTMWNMIKFGFFIAFTIPRLWSLYSTRLTDQGKYWIQLSQHMWDSCPHKKAVAAIVIVLILGFSSNFARIWTGFMLVVAFRYYQQSLVRDRRSETNGGAEEKWEGQRLTRDQTLKRREMNGLSFQLYRNQGNFAVVGSV
ncbi:reticulon-like protein B21 isoform X1 [Punica granatum]|uniref:Reticulon-like protein n=1 Tax=Punica granatum TaxID=22663 RepID=A0A6P8CMG1_PUNGR|nr:reticulon-like protein B21 isoform X1 [Punica granatum]